MQHRGAPTHPLDAPMGVDRLALLSPVNGGNIYLCRVKNAFCVKTEISVPMRFHEKLERLMSRRGETQESLAKAVGVAQTSVGRWLEGSRPRARVAAKLSDYFGLSPEVLFDDRAGIPAESLATEASSGDRAQEQNDATPQGGGGGTPLARVEDGTCPSASSSFASKRDAEIVDALRSISARLEKLERMLAELLMSRR